MTTFQAIILGAIQGLTEFLPISSSGHLVLGQAILHIDQPGNEFEILVHLGTLFSVLVVFFDDIRSILFSLNTKITQKLLTFLVIGTLPAIIVGLGFKDFFESFFENLSSVAIALMFTGLVLLSSFYIKRRDKEHSLVTAIFIGCAQAIAIIPGISRSGMTISAALFLGLSAKEAARFSFLLAIPAISGAGLLTALETGGSFSLSLNVALAGFMSSFFIGVMALRWLLGWLEQGKFYYFGIYCFIIGIITIVI
jgi:undecaprenyl-diphosphatase